CPYCHRNAPAVQDLADHYADLAAQDATYERVQVIDLCLNSNEGSCQSWDNQHNPSYPLLHDSSRYVWSNLMQANSIPQTLITDCTGSLVDYTIGQWDSNDVRKVKAAIERALEVECDAPTR